MPEAGAGSFKAALSFTGTVQGHAARSRAAAAPTASSEPRDTHTSLPSAVIAARDEGLKAWFDQELRRCLTHDDYEAKCVGLARQVCSSSFSFLLTTKPSFRRWHMR